MAGKIDNAEFMGTKELARMLRIYFSFMQNNPTWSKEWRYLSRAIKVLESLREGMN